MSRLVHELRDFLGSGSRDVAPSSARSDRRRQRETKAEESSSESDRWRRVQSGPARSGLLDVDKRQRSEAGRNHEAKRQQSDADMNNKPKRQRSSANGNHEPKRQRCATDKKHEPKRQPGEADRNDEPKRQPGEADRNDEPKRQHGEADRNHELKQQSGEANRNHEAKEQPGKADTNHEPKRQSGEADRNHEPKRQRVEPPASTIACRGLGDLPLALQRNAEGRLDASRLRPDEAWPQRIQGHNFGSKLLDLGSVVFRDVEPFNEPATCRGGRQQQQNNNDHALGEKPGSTGCRFVRVDRSTTWAPSTGWGFVQARCLDILDRADRVLARVEAKEGDEERFWFLFQLSSCAVEASLVTIKSAKYEQSRREVVLELAMDCCGELFDLDKMFHNQTERTNVDEATFEEACRGDLQGRGMLVGRGGYTHKSRLRSARRLVQTLATGGGRSFGPVGPSVRLGVDADDATLNGFLLGTAPRSAIFEGADDNRDADPYAETWWQLRRSSEDYGIPSLLDAATIDDDGTPTPHDNAAGLKTTLYPFQQRGVDWMRRREEAADCLSLHPAWTQYKLPNGRHMYAHRFADVFSKHFFSAPIAQTCGGLLCDDTGLGKSLQVLALILSRPSPPGWAVDQLPPTTTDYVPIKATLIVCPAAILDQWQDEIERHVLPGALTYCIYLGIKGAARKHVDSVRRNVGNDQPSDTFVSAAERRPRRRRMQPRRHGFDDSSPVPVPASRHDPLAGEEEDSRGGVEVLARRSHLFAPPRSASEGEAPPALAQCDIVFVSFETLRDEVRATGTVESSDGARLSTPLGALGFFRIVLDEAQLVSQTTSVAALMCSSLVRRHAWICTATPVNRDVNELHGLLAFLAVQPFSDRYACDQLLLEPLRRRDRGSRARFVALLKGLMLRRGQRRPGVASQIALPPLSWETRVLNATPAERAAISVAREALRRSYNNFTRHQAAAGSRRGGSHLLGMLNGNLTRLRQTICHPAVVNQDRDAADTRNDVLGAAGEVLPLSVVLRRIVSRAKRDALAASLSVLRARLVYIITKRSLPLQPVESYLQHDQDEDDSMDIVCATLASLQTEFSTELALQEDESTMRDGEEQHKRRCKEAFEKLNAEITIFRDRHQEDKMDYDTEIAWTYGGGGVLAAYKTQNEDGNISDLVVSDQDDDDDDEAEDERARRAARAARRRRGGTSSTKVSRDKLAERVVRLVVRHGRDKAPEEALKHVKAAAAACRDKEASRNYLLRELQETENQVKDEGGEDASNALDSANQCPICLESRDPGACWTVAACGHGGCYECMSEWIKQKHMCVLCKRTLTSDMLYTVASPKDAATDSAKSTIADPNLAAIHGSWGTKLGALLLEVGVASRAGEKVVVFSAWTRLLKLAAAACTAHFVSYASLIGSPVAKKSALQEFARENSQGGAVVLLVPLFGGASGQGGGGAAGLTLTHARTAVILEPALQPGIERQAAGRISRIGQRKPATVVRLIIEDTIEPRIVEWQAHRMSDRSRTKGGALNLNDFVQLGILQDEEPEGSRPASS